MPIDWIFGFMGGLMIGCAAALYLLLNGRIMGASGILGGLFDGGDSGARWERAAFLAGLIAVPALLAFAHGGADTHASGNPWILIAAGLLVGVGTRLANGCTSGHGVCGISRLSPRGLLATAIYLTFGVASLLVFKHLLGLI